MLDINDDASQCSDDIPLENEPDAADGGIHRSVNSSHVPSFLHSTTSLFHRNPASKDTHACDNAMASDFLHMPGLSESFSCAAARQACEGNFCAQILCRSRESFSTGGTFACTC